MDPNSAAHESFSRAPPSHRCPWCKTTTAGIIRELYCWKYRSACMVMRAQLQEKEKKSFSSAQSVGELQRRQIWREEFTTVCALRTHHTLSVGPRQGRDICSLWTTATCNTAKGRSHRTFLLYRFHSSFTCTRPHCFVPLNWHLKYMKLNIYKSLCPRQLHYGDWACFQCVEVLWYW